MWKSPYGFGRQRAETMGEALGIDADTAYTIFHSPRFHLGDTKNERLWNEEKDPYNYVHPGMVADALEAEFAKD